MKRFFTRLAGQASPIRLDDYLSTWLPVALGAPVSKSKIRTLIISGSVYVNRHRNKIPSTVLYSGAVLEVYYSESKLSPLPGGISAGSARVEQEHVVYEDEWLIVVNKKSGVPTQPTVDPNRPNLFDLTKEFLKKKQGDSPYLGLHHRLDRDTSGLVLFTKKEEANKGVSELFSKHEIRKTYQCIVWKSHSAESLLQEDAFEIRNYLGKVSAKNEIARFGSVSSNGDLAITRFRKIESFIEALWLEASPQTGRTHQIRVHCSEAGLPILGDPLYFPKEITPLIRVPRLMLHALRLELVHPITRKELKIEAPIPDDFFSVLGGLKA